MKNVIVCGVSFCSLIGLFIPLSQKVLIINFGLRLTGVVVYRCSSKQVFLKIQQNSQENICFGIFFNKANANQSFLINLLNAFSVLITALSIFISKLFIHQFIIGAQEPGGSGGHAPQYELKRSVLFEISWKDFYISSF